VPWLRAVRTAIALRQSRARVRFCKEGARERDRLLIWVCRLPIMFDGLAILVAIVAIRLPCA
jgi:hypothetical protein